MTGITFDLEATNLLNQESIDYCSSPYKLKEDFKVHCIVVEEHDTGDIIAFYDGDKYELDGRTYVESDGEYEYILEDYEPIEYIHKQLKEFPKYIKSKKPTKVVGHNEISYDFLVCKLYFGMDYTVYPDTWCGNSTIIEDTLVISKTLNPDRFGGHSLDNLAQAANREQKIQFRKNIPEDKRFRFFAADMLLYNIFDVKSNTAIYQYLNWEKADWDWEEPIQLEKAVAEIITRQEHRGFKFDKELAEKNIKELDIFMEERRERVEPLLPPRPATKAFEKEMTPPARQVKKNREPSSYLIKFVEKHGGELLEEEEGIKAKIFGNVYDVPMPREPLISEMKATIDDTTHIKNWLVGLNWEPSEWKDKDITLKSGTKIRKDPEQLEKAIDRYVEETLASNFCDKRCEHLGATKRNLKRILTKKCERKSLKVLTNPSFTRGQEKEICPDLERIAEQFPYAKDIVEYLTYKHRRNSILGGGVEWEDEGEAEKGYLANIREDGRIPTPADTCGTPTARFKHRVVVNIPRISSLYGKEMRALFGVDEDYLQIGYDFSSLEARIEAHYCWRWDHENKEYCRSLLMEKPNSVHCRMARKISEVIQRDFTRDSAKNLKYGLSYGAQIDKVSKIVGADLETSRIVFNTFWEEAFPLARLKEALTRYWKNVGDKKFILGIDGRKIYTRAEHALINSLFQSGGMICAKYTMVMHDRLMKEKGLLVDFFKEDWKNKKYSQQIMHSHDEAQLEEKKENFKFKVFDTKEDALKFREEADRFWSEPRKGKEEKFVLAWSPSAELIREAVEKTNEKFNLNVPLAADYMIGRDWCDTH